MSSDDEYGFGEIDDELLSAVDAIESRYRAETAQTIASTSTAPLAMEIDNHDRPLKRQRLDSSASISEFRKDVSVLSTPSTPNLNLIAPFAFAPPPSSSMIPLAQPVPLPRTSAHRDILFDDPPEISVSANGSYVVSQKPSSFRPPPKRPPDAIVQVKTEPDVKLKHTSLVKTAIKANGAVMQKLPSATPEARRQAPLPSTPLSSQTNKPGKISHSTSVIHPTNSRPSSGTSATVVFPAGPPKVDNNFHNATKTGELNELANLQAQVAQFQKEAESLRSLLREAQDAKMMKDGEAKNTKRLMEKQARTHAEAIERVKADREAKIAAALKSQSSLQSTIEGLRAELSFQKQQAELASSGWNTAKRRLYTPARGSSQTPRRQMDNWTNVASTAAKKFAPRATESSPVKSLASHMEAQLRKGGSPIKRPPLEAKQPKEEPVDPGFSAFYNSFGRATSPVKKRDKGKTKEANSSPSKMLRDDEPPQESFQDMRLDESQLDVQDQLELEGPVGDLQYGEHDFADELLFNSSVEWRRELHTVLFSHIPLCLRAPAQGEDPDLTLQILLSVHLPDDCEETLSMSFKQGCALIISAFAAYPLEEDLPRVIESVAKGLVSCALVLADSEMWYPLTAILDLISSLLFLVPPMRDEIARQTALGRDEPHTLSSIVAKLTVKTFPAPPLDFKFKPDAKPPDEWELWKTRLMENILNVVETLAWVTSEERISGMIPFLTTPGCFMHLTSPTQPPWLVARVFKVISVISTHSALALPLLTLEPSKRISQSEATQPVIQRLTLYLTTPHRWANKSESTAIAENLLEVLSMLTFLDEDVAMILMESRWVIPALISFTARASRLIYEEEEDYLTSTVEHQVKVVQILHGSLHLLWYLVKPWKTEYCELRQKILEGAAIDAQFNGLHHVFITAFGRMSFASPPDQLADSAKKALKKTIDIARDILDSVVPPPECDAMWDVYQGEDDSEGGSDEHLSEADEDLVRQQGMQIDDIEME